MGSADICCACQAMPWVRDRKAVRREPGGRSSHSPADGPEAWCFPPRPSGLGVHQEPISLESTARSASGLHGLGAG